MTRFSASQASMARRHAFCDVGVAAFLRALTSPIVSLHLYDNVEPDRENTESGPAGSGDASRAVRLAHDVGRTIMKGD